MKFPISRLTVIGNSMTPALKEGQDILSFNWAYLFSKPKKGDIVIVQNSKLQAKSEIVKRVVKVEGKQVFVEGDNKRQSTDSRHFGPIRIDQIIGKVIFP